LQDGDFHCPIKDFLPGIIFLKYQQGYFCQIMKARLPYLFPALLFAWPLIAMYSCLPCARCSALPCSATKQTVHYSAGKFFEYAGFNQKPQVIPLQRKGLREISGIAASHQYKDVLYVHEDNGHSNCLYVTNNRGDDIGRLIIRNSHNRDWEDIAVGPGPSPEHHYIYVADIGDNHAWRCNMRIYRLPEPQLENRTGSVRKTVKGVEVITLKYPDRPHNAEAILLDPLTRDVYIATKEDDSCRIFVARYPQSTRHKMILEPVITLPFRLVTSGNIASNGLEILLRNEEYYWYWKRTRGETVTEALRKPPKQITPATEEPQGEAICFASDQHGYFTCSEAPGKQAPVIYFYKRKS
jgi:hypothetical protein